MGTGHRDYAPNLSPVGRPQVDPFDFSVHEDKERAQAITAEAIKEQLGLAMVPRRFIAQAEVAKQYPQSDTLFRKDKRGVNREYIDVPLETIARQIPSAANYWATPSGRVISARNPKIVDMKDPRPYFLKPLVNPKGYLFVMIRRNDWRRSSVAVHRVVAETFIGPCPPGYLVRHMDGNPANNAYTNLQYGTHLDNHADSVRHGTVQWFHKTKCFTCVKHGSACPIGPTGIVRECVEYVAKGEQKVLCNTCGNTSCPIEDKRATQCVEYYPLNPTEDK
jgi:hypothetical protein